ncbi:hypothetical protein K5I29_09620 [Flavobacterium agricola]|uniref:DUF937 domain-containing protein n=1 Tax=Flavobacterium agricola TaxID=2870839 RepID=A0ABY6LWR5_9FLAO|nr:hypothetical protein [Flavobacterium agricola]UYW00770.1 hypothetical protein K5I29_09620 [Flavobacterium agricola]
MNQFASVIQNFVQQQMHTISADEKLVPEVAEQTSESIFNGISNALKQGKTNEVLALFNDEKSNLASNPLVSQIVSGLTTNLASKFGIDAKKAEGFASSVIPTVLQFFKSKNESGESGFNITDILSGLGGKDAGGILSNLSAFGLDKLAEGKVDVKDALAALTDSKNEGKNSGLGGMLGGLFSKK